MMPVSMEDLRHEVRHITDDPKFQSVWMAHVEVSPGIWRQFGIMAVEILREHTLNLEDLEEFFSRGLNEVAEELWIEEQSQTLIFCITYHGDTHFLQVPKPYWRYIEQEVSGTIN